MKHTTGKQLIALLVAFLMVFNGFAVTAGSMVFAEPADYENVDVLAFTSDVHNDQKNYTGQTRLGTWIDNIVNQYGKIDAMAFGGDMAQYNSSDSKFWSETQGVMDVVEGKGIAAYYTTGNHEYDHDSSITNDFYPDKNATTRKYIQNDWAVSDNNHNYRIYCMGVGEASNYTFANNAYTANQVSILSDKLAAVDNSKPIFIITHFPLHYTSQTYSSNSRSITRASDVIDVLNNAANGDTPSDPSDDKKIIFLWGHNHSLNSPNDPHYDTIYQKGSTLQYDSSHSKEVDFYYAAAGSMSDTEKDAGSGKVEGKGLVATVKSNGLISLAYYKADGTTVTKNGGPFEETEPTEVERFMIDEEESELSVEVGRKIQIHTAVEPEDASDYTVSWSSSDTTVATVDNSGQVTGISEGQATITATLNDNIGGETHEASIDIEVVPRTTSGTPYVLTNTLTPGKNYLIVSANSGDAFALKNNNGTVSKAEVSVDGDTIYTDDESIVFEAQGSGTTVGNLLNGGLYLKASSGGLQVLSTAGDNRPWEYNSSNHTLRNYKATGTSYYYVYYSNNAFTTTKETNPSSSQRAYIFEEDDSVVSYTVTFRVENGKWSDNTTEEKTVTLTGPAGTTLKLSADQIPAVGSKPDTHYEEGAWDITPNTSTAITEDTTYTYSYEFVDHNWDGGVVTLAPTCTEEGVKTYTCSVGGETRTEAIPANGHAWEDEFTEDTAPTCTEAGSKSKHCSVCDAIDESTITEIPATGHSFGDWTEVTPSGCENEGLEQRVCETCGFTESRNLDPSGHDWEDDFTVDLEPTCTLQGSKSIHCKNCDAVKDSETIDVLGHDYQVIDGTAVAATCTENGKAANQECSRCHDVIEGAIIERLGHDYQPVEGTAVEATCTEEGKEADQKCSRCHDEIQGKATEALGHDYQEVEGSAVAATCTTGGKKADQECSRCHDVINGDPIEAAGHNLTTHPAVAATCTAAGNSAYWSCDRCEKFFSDAAGINEIEENSWVIDATGHNMTPHEAVTATCTEPGSNAYWSCDKCGKFFSDNQGETEIDENSWIIPAGHDMTHHEGVAATCTENGSEEYWNCNKCHKYFADEAGETEVAENAWIIPAGHDWSKPTYEWAEDNSSVTAEYHCTAEGCNEKVTETSEVTSEVTKQATCEEAGTTKYTATFRDAEFATQEKTDDTKPAALGHTWGDVTYTWAEDNKTVTAKRVCGRDDSHVEEETVNTSSSVTQAATCTLPEKTTWTAEFTNEAFETQTKTEQTAEANGHDWSKPRYDWADDYGSVTGHYNCTTDGCNEEVTETVNTTSEVTKQATCIEAGETTYTAVFTKGDLTTQTEVDDTKPAALGHNMEEHAAVAATCTEEGNSAYWSCDKCGKFFSDAQGETEIEADSWIIAAGHNMETHLANDPTCTEAGNSAYWSCDKCNKFFSDPAAANEIEENSWVIGATGHNLTPHAAVAATCTEAGNEAYWSCDKCGKFFSDEEGNTEIRENSWAIDALGHDWIEATYTAPKTCRRCGETEGEAKSHDTSEERYVEVTQFVDGRDYIVAVTKDDSSVYAIANAGASNRVSGATLSLVPSSGNDAAYIVTDNAAAVWNYTSSNQFLTNDSLHLNRAGSSGNYYPIADSSSGREAHYVNGKLYLKKSSSNSTYYVTCNNGTFGLSDNENGGDKVRLFEKTTVDIRTQVVKFVDEDGNVLQESEVVRGQIPSYTGETPIKEGDENHTYTFAGWRNGTNEYGVEDKLPAAVADVTYTAIFSEHQHTWDNGTVTTEPTCTAKGVKTFHCENCDATRTEDVDALGHHKEAHAAVAATCTEPGNSAYWSCDRCNNFFSDAECKNVIEENSWIVNAIGHDYQTVEGSAVAATCTTDGKEADQKCSHCNDVIEGKTIEATGHSWGEVTYTWSDDNSKVTAERVCTKDESHKQTETVNTTSSVTQAATCTLPEKTTWTSEDFDNEAFKKQSKTGQTKDALGHHKEAHVAVEATCTTAGNSAYWSCDRCNKFFSDEACEHEIAANSWVIDAKGHKWDEGTITTQPTCTTKGVKTFECENCDATRTEDVDALGHHKEAHAAVEATCTTAGNSAYWSCDRCEKFFSDAECEHEIEENSWVIAAKGHKWDNGTVTTQPTCTAKGVKTFHCENCDATRTEDVDALGHHKEAHAAVEATCTTAGNSAYWSCDRCEKFFSDADCEHEIEENSWVINATGHDWSKPTYEWARDNSSVTAEYHCTAEGCNEKVTETAEVAAEVTKQATCEEAGTTKYTATFRDAEFATQEKTDDTKPAALGHTWGDVTYTWTDDNSTVTAKRVCGRDDSHVEEETVNTSSSVTQAATCTLPEKTTWTAEFTNDAFETQTKTEQTAKANGHDWSKPRYDWADDYSSVTGHYNCTTNGCNEEVTETVNTTSEVTKQATCTEAGETTYTATFEDPRLEDQEAVDSTKPAATGHTWGVVTYTWSEDNSKVTAERVCTKDESHKQTETVDSTSEVTQNATCTDPEKTTWTSEVFENEAFQKQTKTEQTADATGHAWGDVTYTWADDNSTVTAKRVCRNDDSHVEEETVSATAAVTQQASCTLPEKTTWTSEVFENEAFQKQTKTEQTANALGHNMTPHAAVAATCTAAGNSAYWSCDRCHKYFSDEEGNTEVQENSWVIEAKGHKYGEWTKLDDEQHKRVCEHDASHVEKANHTWDDGEVTTAATCTTKGEKTYTCTVCGATKTEKISKIKHNYGAWTKLNETQHQRVCKNNKSHVEKANHTWGSGKVTKKATLTATGTKTFTCTVCGATKTSTIARTSIGKAKVASATGNTGKKTYVVKINKVGGASGYKVSYRKANAAKWSTKNAGNTSYNLTGLTFKGLYQIKAQATKNATATTEAVTGSNANVEYCYLNSARNLKYVPGSKRITMSWAKDTHTTGYEVQYSTRKDMKNAKVIKHVGNTKTTRILTGLVKGKTYYVRIRPYKKYKGKTYQGVWSAVKAVKSK